MANSVDVTSVNGNSVFSLKDMGMQIISTLFQSCPILAAMGIMNSNKADNFWDPGSPEAGILITGADITPMQKKEADEIGQYSPLLESIRQDDITNQPYRGNVPTLAVGSGATFSVTVTAGAITAVSVTNGGSGYAGASPTMIAVDSVGAGQGARLTATIAGGQVTAVSILSGGYSYTAVTLIAQTGATAGTKNARPVFKWTHFSSPLYVYHRDIRRNQAMSQYQEDVWNRSVSDLATAEIKRKIAGMIQQVEYDAIFGTPTLDGGAQTDDLWTHQFGLQATLDYTNNYAGFDRTDVNNYFWRAQKVTDALTLTLEGYYADAMFTRGLSANGGNLDVSFVGPTIFSKWQKESQAYTTNMNTDPNVMVLKRQFGFQIQVIKYNTTYVILDNRVPANTIFGCDMRPWCFMTRSGANFAVDGWADQRKVEGGKDAMYSVLDMQYMLFCQAPGLGQISYTAVT